MKYEQRRSDDYLHTNINNRYSPRQKSVAIFEYSVFDNNNNEIMNKKNLILIHLFIEYVCN